MTDKRDMYQTCRVRDDSPTVRAGQFAAIVGREREYFTLRFADDRTVKVHESHLERFVL
jgi:hypothetical protein